MSIQVQVVRGVGAWKQFAESSHNPLASSLARGLRLVRAVLVVLAPVWLSACAMALRPGEEELRHHAIFVGSEGNAKHALTKEEARQAGISTDAPMTPSEYREYLDSMVAAIRRNESDTLLLFIHGGRVGLRSGADKSLELTPAITASGYYPLFIVWDASQWTALGWHLARYHKGLDYGRSAKWIMPPFVIASDLLGAVGRSPFTLGHQLADLCRGAMRLFRHSGRPSDASCPLVGPDRDERRRLQPIEDSTRVDRVIERIAARQSKKGKAVDTRSLDSLGVSWGRYELSAPEQAYRSITSVLYFPIKLPLGILVDGLGTGAWDDMMRRTTAMFRPGTELRGPYVEGLPPARRPSGATGALLDALATMIREDSSASHPRRWRLIIVGHSMGAIVANRILREYPELPIVRVQHLASAASIADVESSVVPFLRSHRGSTFEMATLQPFAEAGELQDQKPFGKLADIVIPRGSLLEWIDDYFENARSPFDRRSGKWRNVALGLHIFPDGVRSRVTIKSFGVGDSLDVGTRFASHPARHGEVADTQLRFWCRDYWALRNRGTPVYALDGAGIGSQPGGAQRGCPPD